MAIKEELLSERFVANMARIGGLVRLLDSSDELRKTGIFQSQGTRADVLRASVVFLHATFEDLLRSHLPKPGRGLSPYSRTDLEKALKLIKVDASPFRPLFRPLVAMAKRRKRIVHDADLPDSSATISEPWGIADDWQLMMWLMAVMAFYYQLRVSLGTAGIAEREMCRRLSSAMEEHLRFANQLLALPNAPAEQRRLSLEEILVTLEKIQTALRLEVDDFLDRA